MSMESILLTVESVLLVLTMIAIFFSNRESARSRVLAAQMDKTIRSLARFEYFQIVINANNTAKARMDCLVTGHKTDFSEGNLNQLLDSVKKAAGRGVKIRFLLPKLQDRLFMGNKYVEAGTDVRYATGFVAHSLRYVVVDRSYVIIATPPPDVIGVDQATRKGYMLVSDELAFILEGHFEDQWEKAVGFNQYISEVMDETGLSLPELAKEMDIETAELTKVYTPDK